MGYHKSSCDPQTGGRCRGRRMICYAQVRRLIQACVMLFGVRRSWALEAWKRSFSSKHSATAEFLLKFSQCASRRDQVLHDFPLSQDAAVCICIRTLLARLIWVDPIPFAPALVCSGHVITQPVGACSLLWYVHVTHFVLLPIGRQVSLPLFNGRGCVICIEYSKKSFEGYKLNVLEPGLYK